MLFINLITDYFIWHYSRAVFELLHIWKNFIWYTIHLFSIQKLLKTWISPFKRITENRRRAWDFEDFIGSILIGLLSRIIGFFIRTVFIAVGLLFLTLVLILGLGIALTWIILPVVPITLIVFGLAVLIV